MIREYRKSWWVVAGILPLLAAAVGPGCGRSTPSPQTAPQPSVARPAQEALASAGLPQEGNPQSAWRILTRQFGWTANTPTPVVNVATPTTTRGSLTKPLPISTRQSAWTLNASRPIATAGWRGEKKVSSTRLSPTLPRPFTLMRRRGPGLLRAGKRLFRHA